MKNNTLIQYGLIFIAISLIGTLSAVMNASRPLSFASCGLLSGMLHLPKGTQICT